MKDEEILLPEKVDVKVGERTYPIGVMSIKQGWEFSNFIIKTIFSSQDKLKAIQDKTKDSKSNAQDIQAIMELLDEHDLYKLFGIILKEKDLTYLENNLDIENGSQILADFLERNNPEVLKKNILRIAGLFTKMFPAKVKTS